MELSTTLLYYICYEQAISDVIIVGKRMFNLEWKRFDEGKEITIDTVPEKRMNRKMCKARWRHSLCPRF